MPNITIQVTPDTLNIILQALNDSVAFRQQSVAILINSLQSQANSQLQPVNAVPSAAA